MYTHVRFGCAELELDDSNLCLFHARWTASGGDYILVEDDAIHQFCILDGAADFLDYTDIS